ncbi:LuxR family transcriptional regulatory protein [Yersinia frederiksenii]|uniref:LuxR C-terminal-related transcriptional regulator n=1 Tax=Yersinia alsatica TaxID=2890317 RepID=A0ABY5UV23_9GAMM|nr:LuxR C-terminal-related transcriptional regulator [Yersinia alsatica]OVZ93154.1 helix-turn-helix transcriptional regulator [Yersinia frederiksenii]OWF70293.1 helix-turn-helix transcriptional regulator [Yersinia frederiksenii]UWM46570.1 LuxR C-terminal-related transcriptional regulator [Yersinia alsatica]CND64087.1 LuxR family transcriptional regulatory protein [Yersinia frederiksenii]CNI68114.1 LuxR family transcriptional regulatory protein [Yersinia frederiksenii]
MEEKQVIIQHACQFTRFSMKDILSNVLAMEPVNIVDHAESLNDVYDNLVRFPSTHMVVLSLYGYDYCYTNTFGLIINWLQENRATCRVVIIADISYIRLLEHYFYGIDLIYTMIAQAAPISHFVDRLTHVFFQATPTKRFFYRKRHLPLSKREQTVMRLLLQGNSNNNIATILQLSNKTVSYYKRSALSKLGIPSLQPMLILPISQVVY